MLIFDQQTKKMNSSTLRSQKYWSNDHLFQMITGLMTAKVLRRFGLLLSTHFRQNFRYSEDVNKNPVQLFVLPYLFDCTFHISVSLHTKEKNIFSNKNKGLMTSFLLWRRFELKNLKKLSCWVKKKNKTIKWSQKFLNYVLQLHQAVDQKWL